MDEPIILAQKNEAPIAAECFMYNTFNNFLNLYIKKGPLNGPSLLLTQLPGNEGVMSIFTSHKEVTYV